MKLPGTNCHYPHTFVNKYIKALISQGEHQTLDFKFEISDSCKIARTLVAFANTDGGKLLVGVKDNGAIVGVRSDEELYMVEAALEMYCRPRVDVTSRTWIVDGKTVVEVEVLKSTQKPHLAPDKNNKWRAFVRVADQNIAAPGILRRAWEYDKKQGLLIRFGKEENMLMHYLRENGEIGFAKARQLCGWSARRTEGLLARLVSAGIIGYRLTDEALRFSLKE